MKLTKLFIGLGMVGLAAFGYGASNAEAAEVTHTVKSGDTLSTIAQQYYGDASKYPVIAEVNNISDAHFIMVGQVLKFDTDNTTASQPAVAQTTTQSAPATQPTTQKSTPKVATNVSGSESEAKEWIAFKESSGSYTARNGQYYGRYQLNPSLYVGYDTTPAGQEAAADAYVKGRYGSWVNAKAFWVSNGWY